MDFGLKEKVALCVNNSLLAAPMLVQNEVAAILCLRAPDRRFDERHLELLVITAESPPWHGKTPCIWSGYTTRTRCLKLSCALSMKW